MAIPRAYAHQRAGPGVAHRVRDGPGARSGGRRRFPDRSGGPLPGSFTWSSTGPLISAKPDATHPIVSVKDPTVFRYEDRWHSYATDANTAIVLSEPNRFDLFEASNVYRIGDSGRYLMLVEALATKSDWRRHFRAWTADSPDGSWTPPAESEANAFILSNNVTFAAGQPAWTADVGHGDLIRDGADQTQAIDPCRPRFVYQGTDPASGGDHSRLPWRLGLLTQTDSSC